MLPVNHKPSLSQIPTTVVPIKAAFPTTKKKGPSGQATSFLRRRKVVQVLAQRAEDEYHESINSPDLKRFEDYPILDMEEEFQGEVSREGALAARMKDPEHDECLVAEFWAVQGAVNGTPMRELPWNNQNSVPSVDQ